MKQLERYETLSPIYGGGRTNHLPMIITALYQLGVDEDHISFIAEHYHNEFGVPDLSDKTHPKLDFEEEYITLTNVFLAKINKQGRDNVLSWYLSKSKLALITGTFHGLIRIFYANLVEEDLFLAQALAYFDLIYFECNLEFTYVDDLVKHFKELLLVKEKTVKEFKNERSMEKIEELLGYKEIRDKLFSTNKNKEEEMLGLFLEEYDRTRSFYALHTITSFHALYNLKEFYTSEEYNIALDNFFVHALLLLLLDTKPVDRILPNNKTIHQKALSYTDAHHIKLLYSLQSLQETFKHPLIQEIISYS